MMKPYVGSVVPVELVLVVVSAVVMLVVVFLLATPTYPSAYIGAVMEIKEIESSSKLIQSFRKRGPLRGPEVHEI